MFRMRLAVLMCFLGLAGAVSVGEATGIHAGDEDFLLPPDLGAPRDVESGSVALRAPFLLPPRPGPRYLGLIFADGRPAYWDSLLSYGRNYYWPVEHACAALGATLFWDPALLRGELRIDSLSFGFVVGGEVIHCGETAYQMAPPVLYLGNRLLLPLDFLPMVVDSILSDTFLFKADSLYLIQRALGPPAPPMQMQQVGNRTYIKWRIPEQPEATFETDGIGGLSVDIPGVFVDPLDPPRAQRRDGARLYAIGPNVKGTEFLFRVDSSVRAWRLQWRTDPGELTLTLSANAGDLKYRTYHPWSAAARADELNREGAVVLVLPREKAGAYAGGDRRGFLRAIGTRVKTVLEERLGLRVVVIEDSKDSGWVPEANARGGGACLCLRFDMAGDKWLPGCRIVTAPSRPGERPLTPLDEKGGQGAPPGVSKEERSAGGLPLGLRRWESVGASHAEGTGDLAWLLAFCLQREFPKAAIRRPHWPVAFLEGLDMPGAILYIGDLNSGTTPGHENAGQTIDCLVSAVARALGSFLIPRSEERM
ncbi:MAG: hypothetical protein KAY24_08070 [Candidatus Eisenbacteria sp.]|nr:hypothetical protein [Candidatus Eisenbacteria bacterium]